MLPPGYRRKTSLEVGLGGHPKELSEPAVFLKITPSLAPEFGVGFPLQSVTRVKNISLTHHTPLCHDFLCKILSSGTQQSSAYTTTVRRMLSLYHLSLGGTASAVS